MSAASLTSRPAAFFDIDNTIVTGSNTLSLYIKYLVQKKMMSRYHLARAAVLSALHKLDLVNIEKLLDAFALSYKDRSHAELKRLTDEWFAQTVVPRIARQAHEKIAWHKAQGHVTCVLSTATQYVCEPMRDLLELDGSINTNALVHGDNLTGLLQKPLCYHSGKVHYARKFAEKHGVDLAHSYFYTDSVTDLPMLEAVGHPIAVNPDPLLKREAGKRGWSVERWSLT